MEINAKSMSIIMHTISSYCTIVLLYSIIQLQHNECPPPPGLYLSPPYAVSVLESVHCFNVIQFGYQFWTGFPFCVLPATVLPHPPQSNFIVIQEPRNKKLHFTINILISTLPPPPPNALQS